MKNLLFLEQFSNISGGQVVLLNILSRIDRGLYRPYVAIPKKGELSDELDKIKVSYFILPIGDYSAGSKNIIDLINYLFRSIVLIPLTIRTIKKMDIDLIYANAPRTFFWGTIAAKISGTPIIWHLHSIIKGIELKLCLFISKLGIDKILAISLSVAEPFIRNNKRLSSRIEIIYNGVDTKKYSPSSAGKKIRHELGLSDGDKVVGYIGQIAKWKGVEVFVNAASEVLAARQNVIFLVVGDVLFGGKGAVDFKKHILDIVQRLNMTGNVKFLGKRSDIADILSAIDMLVVPSIEPEPLSLALLEAMATGKVVLASSHGGPAEVITDGKDGRLFEPGNYHELASAILMLINDPKGAERMGMEGRKRVESGLDLESYIKAVHRAVSSVLK